MESRVWAEERRRIYLGAIALLAICVVGCRPAPAGPKRTVLEVATRADVTGIFPNPPYQAELFSIDVNANLFDSLVRFDRELRVLPGLAERWENPDDLTWVFQLRPDAVFSDGAAVRAPDVVASLRTSVARNTPLLPGDTVEADGALRVVIRTARRNPHLLARLQSAFVLPEKALAQNPVPAIGSGPYRLVSWTPGRELRLERNPHYHGAAQFDEVRLRVIPESAARLEELLSGRAAIADSVPPEDVARLAREPRLRVVSHSSLRVLFLAFRVDRPPFDDPRVRRAVRLAVDQHALIRNALAGQATPATQLVPPEVFGYNEQIPPTRPDRAEARRLLAEAGFEDGLSVELYGPSDRWVNDVQILEELRRQLGPAGIEVSVQAMPKSRFFAMLRTEPRSFFIFGWVCNTLFGGDALEALIRTRGVAGQGEFNHQGISDATLDALTEQSLQAVTSSARRAAIQKAMALVAEKELVVPLLIQRESTAIAREVAWEPERGLALRFEQMRPAER